MRSELTQIFRKCLYSVNPGHLINSSVSTSLSELKIKHQTFQINKNCYLVGFGKAVYEMAIEIEKIIGDHLCKGIISVPLGMTSTFSSHLKENTVIEVIEGGKDNLPDENSFLAALGIKNLADKLTLGDIMIVLISGGGSALLSYPIPPITIEEKTKTIRLIANAGANIVELNTVRKEISLIKGGKLAKLAHPATIVALILSDIVGDPIDFIASGPTVLSHNFSSNALEILRKYKLMELVPESVKTVLNTTEKRRNLEINEKIVKNIHNVIIGNNMTVLEAAMKEAELFRYCPILLSNDVTGLVSHVAHVYVEVIQYICKFVSNGNKNDFFNYLKSVVSVQEDDYLSDFINQLMKHTNTIQQLNDGKTICFISGGEPTVKVTGTGLGGRNQQLVLEIGIKLHELKSKFDYVKEFDISFLSAGTDGIDGPTDAAGAICNIDLVEEAHKCGLIPEKFLKNNDSYTFFSLFNSDSHIKIGQTGTNVMDVHMILIKKKISQ